MGIADRWRSAEDGAPAGSRVDDGLREGASTGAGAGSRSCGKAQALTFAAFFCYAVWIHFNFTSYQFISLNETAGMGLAYDVSVYANGVALLLAAVLSKRLSGRVFDSGMMVAAAFLCAIGTLLSMTAGTLVVSNGAVEAAAGVMTGVGSAVVVMMLAFTMLAVRDSGVLCVFAFLLANAVCSFAQWLPALVLLVLVIVMPIVSMVCMFVVHADARAQAADGAAAPGEPTGDLRAMAPLIVRACVFVLVAFSGMSVARVFAQTSGAHADPAALLAATLAFGALLAVSLRGEREGMRSVSMFRVVFLASIVGLFSVPLFEGSFDAAYGVVAVFNTLIRAFVLVIEYRVCVKTQLSPLVVFGVGECVKKVPTLAVRSAAAFLPIGDFMAEPMVHIKLFIVAGIVLAFVYGLVFTEEHMVQLCATDAAASADDRAARAREALADRYRLTEREREVLGYLCDARTASWIADKLFISTSTVNVHTKNIYRKCDVHSRQELMDLLKR